MCWPLKHCDPGFHSTLSVSSSDTAGEREAWLVGEVHRTRMCARHQRVLCRLLKQPRRLLWHHVSVYVWGKGEKEAGHSGWI